MTTQFLWGGGKRPRPGSFVPRGRDWWCQYSNALRLTGPAKQELQTSCREMTALLPDPQSWGIVGRPFCGLAVGAVQSGKTGSMIGLTAMALDQGYRIVVVLSGNKDDLRRQTARRFNSQLLRRSEEIAGSGGARTLPADAAGDAMPAYSLPYDRDAHQYAAFHNGFQAALARGHPAVVVIKKHMSSLADVRRKLDIAYERYGVDALPTLVLDDECDDASVDRNEMLVPDAIGGLWRRNGAHPHVAYVGYTATSAANLLQDSKNELFPRDCVVLLRYPSSEDSALSFAEPSPDRWYTGGHTYYETFEDALGARGNFLVVAQGEESQLPDDAALISGLEQAVRAYIVSGAFRSALRPWTWGELGSYPAPHAMLIQASAAKADHRAVLNATIALFGGARDGKLAVWRWSAESVMRAIERDESEWKFWYDDFAQSRARVLEERPRVGACAIVTWNSVKAAIPAFIAETQIKIVNSEDGFGSDLDFETRVAPDGSPKRPQDVFVVAIGGARLSRGITIEGLCTTVYSRWSNVPTEDTVLQLSRWFGYRGPHLEFCRLFTTPSILYQLGGICANDRELREELAALMQAKRSPADAAVVIGANPRALPTDKIGEGRVHDLSFSPFATVLRRVEIGDVGLQRANEEAAHRLSCEVKARSSEVVVAASGAARGILSRSWSAIEVADILDGVQFAGHNPSAIANPARDFYRRPDTTRPVVCDRALSEDPYQIAAYLRQWAANGDAPKFNVGVAFGEMDTEGAPFSFPLVNREITAEGEVVGGWTGRRVGWRGDQMFDGPPDADLAKGTSGRLEGASGLLLMYVVHKDAVGRYGRGHTRHFHTPVFAVVIPAGGATWRRVTVDRRGVVDA